MTQHAAPRIAHSRAPSHGAKSKTRKTTSKQPSSLPMPSELFDASESADVVTVPARHVLAYEGAGAPESDAFQRAVGALYGIAYTVRFARKAKGQADFKIGPLEARWWAALSGTEFVKAPRESWRWQLRIALPDDVTDAEVAAAVQTATTKKGGKLENSEEAKHVHVEHVPAQVMGRALHVGPYAVEGRTFDAIESALAAAGKRGAFSHLEIYVSDPRRTVPARLRTVLLRETRA